MGWASGGEVFEPVADKLIELNAPEDVKREVCAVLIKELQNRGWDTESESLGMYPTDPAIIAAFKQNGVVQTCANEDGPGWVGWCELELGHAGDHDDDCGNTWPKAADDDA